MKTLNFMLQSGPPTLHYYCAVVLHSCIVLLPVGHSSNHQHHLKWTVTIPLCTRNRFIKLNRLYTAYKQQLQIYN